MTSNLKWYARELEIASQARTELLALCGKVFFDKNSCRKRDPRSICQFDLEDELHNIAWMFASPDGMSSAAKWVHEELLELRKCPSKDKCFRDDDGVIDLKGSALLNRLHKCLVLMQSRDTESEPVAESENSKAISTLERMLHFLDNEDYSPTADTDDIYRSYISRAIEHIKTAQSMSPHLSTN